MQEERFTRVKHDHNFPVHAINYCLTEAKITPKEIDHIVFYDKPFLKFDRLLETYLAFAPAGITSFITSLPVWLKEKLFQRSNISKTLNDLWGNSIDWDERLLFSEHHLSHAASAFFPSPFKSAAILTMDGVGEWTTTSVSIGNENKLSILKEIKFPHSLGLLYSAFTYYTGFKVNSGEYKVMGLAPYGVPRFASLIKDNLIDIKDDGSFALNMEYFNYATGLTMTSNKFHRLFGAPPRNPESELTQREMDLAASIQSVTEEIVIKLARGIAKDTSERNLCLAGGVSLNCVANGKLLREKIFEKIWIQPASGDAGGALGAALAIYYLKYNKRRKLISKKDGMKGSYLGPEYSQKEINVELKKCGAIFALHNTKDIIDLTAKELVSGKAIGWMNGRMEFGPRSLGGRSIIADPRTPGMMKNLNLKVKFRESFRPFVPSVLYEDAAEWFDIDIESPYMLHVANVDTKKRKTLSFEQDLLFGIDKLNICRSEIPAVTHVDYSARVQTVHKETNPLYYKLIKRFKKITGYPVLINTSFNVRGEPIVCSPTDAFKCFMGTGLDVLVIGNAFLLKSEQPEHLIENYQDKYKLD